MRRAFPAILAAAAAALAFAAAPARAQVKNPDTFVYASISDIDSLDPAWAYDSASLLVISNTYENLFIYDGTSTQKLLPLVAAEVPSRANGLISADGRTYVIPLRRDVTFQDGSRMTPEDVRYSILRYCLEDRDGGPSSLLLEPLTGEASTRDAKGAILPDIYEKLDRAVRVRGHDLVVRLPRPFAPILTIFAGYAPVVSKAWGASHGGWDGREATWKSFNNPSAKEASPLHDHVFCTGPFTLDRWDKDNKEVVLIRNDRYWRKPARLKYVRIEGVDEFSTRKLLLQGGDADSIRAELSDESQLEGLPGVSVEDDFPTVEMDPVLFFTVDIDTVGNPDVGSGLLDGDGIPHDFFADVDVRKAFAYSIDYKGLIRDLYRGKATQATGCIPKTLFGQNPDQKTYAFDPAQAEAHLRKAWGGRVWDQGFRFTLSYNEGQVLRQVLCLMLKRNIEALNPKFQIDVRPIQWSTFLDRSTAHKLPAFALGWNADYPDPHNFVFPMLDSQGTYPQSQNFKDARFDRLIEEGVHETDPDKRRAIYYKIQALEYEVVPHVVLVDTVHLRAARSWVHGFIANPMFSDSPWAGYFYTMWKE